MLCLDVVAGVWYQEYGIANHLSEHLRTLLVRNKSQYGFIDEGR